MFVHRITLLSVTMAALVATPALAQKQYGPGVSEPKSRSDRPSPIAGRPPPRHARKGRSRLFQVAKRQGRHQRPQDHLHQSRRCLLAAQGGGEARSLVEGDEVALIFGVLGTPLNMAIRPYLNKQGVPQLFVAAGSSALNDPAHFPWTMGWQPNLRDEAKFYAKNLLAHNPKPKIGVLYQNDDFGKDLLNGLKEGLGEDADKMIVSARTFSRSIPRSTARW